MIYIQLSVWCPNLQYLSFSACSFLDYASLHRYRGGGGASIIYTFSGLCLLSQVQRRGGGSIIYTLYILCLENCLSMRIVKVLTQSSKLNQVTFHLVFFSLQYFAIFKTFYLRLEITVVQFLIKLQQTYICMIAVAGKMVEPNWLRLFEETQGYPGGNTARRQ